MKEKSQSEIVLRWAACLPSAMLAGWLAWLLVMFGNKLTIGMQGLDSDAFPLRAFIEFISAAASGGAFVYGGAKVAPSHNQVVAYVLAGLGLVAAGVMLFPAFVVRDYWAVWSGISTAIGIGATAYSISIDEVKI